MGLLSTLLCFVASCVQQHVPVLTCSYSGQPALNEKEKCTEYFPATSSIHLSVAARPHEAEELATGNITFFMYIS